MASMFFSARSRPPGGWRGWPCSRSTPPESKRSPSALPHPPVRACAAADARFQLNSVRRPLRCSPAPPLFVHWHELLDAFAGLHLAGVDVSLRVGGDGVDEVEH